MALTKKQSWCRRMSPPSEAHFRFLSGGCVLWRVFGASLSLSWSKCFCVTEDGRNVFLSWNSDPAILWCPQGLHWVDFNRALWNFGHLISTRRCQSLCQNYRCVGESLCVPFSLCSFSWSLDFLEWVWEWVSPTQCPPRARLRAGTGGRQGVRDSTGVFCMRAVHTILNGSQYESCFKTLNFIVLWN